MCTLFQWLSAQYCNYATMTGILQKSTHLLVQDVSPTEDLEIMKIQLEETLVTCSKKEFPGKDTLECNYIQNLIEICSRMADIQNMVKYLNRIKEFPMRDRKYSDVEGLIAHIKYNYGPLRIRFEEEVLEEMATLKTSTGKEMNVHFLPPPDAWRQEKPQNRVERLKRLDYLHEQSLAGDLKVFFDSYDVEVEYFYFELPYVPYLEQSNNTEDWYAITFDNKKRYRTNFSRPNARNQVAMPLIIKPEVGWILETSIPEKWVKLTFPKTKGRIKFEDSQTEARLTPGEYIEIQSDLGMVDYYLPSDRNINIIFSEKGHSLNTYLSKFLYSGIIFVIGYFFTMELGKS